MSLVSCVNDLSRKRSYSAPSAPCIGGCGNPSCDQKRAAKASDAVVRWWYLKLESESDPFDSDEPESLKNESLWSVQLQETDTVQDSSDSERRWLHAHANEYEVTSLHSSDNEIRPFPSSSEDESCSSVEGLVIATVAPDGITIDYFADSSSDLSSSDDSSDPELQPQDKWACLRCKQKNQPIPRYCQHCFAVRKKWFPPRPAARKKRNISNITIPPQIQITPTLSIPDLSEMKGDPLADKIQRSYDESVARFAKLTEEERLQRMCERVRLHKLFRSHSEGPVIEQQAATAKIETKVKSTLLEATSRPKFFDKRSICTEDSSQDSSARTSYPPRRLKARKLKSKLSTCSGDTVPKDEANIDFNSLSDCTPEVMDYRSKVKAYLEACELPDTPPQSQLPDDGDCVDGPRKPQQQSQESTISSATVVESQTKSEDTLSLNSVINTSTKVCTFCEANEANTAFIHNGKGHLCACYTCAKRVYAAKGQCPICQRQASTICKIYS